jgi:Uma2 family endonuclease
VHQHVAAPDQIGRPGVGRDVFGRPRRESRAVLSCGSAGGLEVAVHRVDPGDAESEPLVQRQRVPALGQLPTGIASLPKGLKTMRVHGMTKDVGFGPYTVLDLHELPEDGKGFELEDGWLVEVAAGSRHNWVLRNLSRLIENAAARAGSAVIVCEGGEWEISTPAGIRKPDVSVITRETARSVILDETPKVIPGRELLLVAEVISPGSSSERTDRVRKVREYASLGIPQYWIVEHFPEPKVQILMLGEAGYLPGASAVAGTELAADVEADKPFSVSFDPASLLAF